MRKSFSSEVKDELCELNVKNTDEAASELAAMLLFGENKENENITLKSDRASTAARIQFLLRKSVGKELPIDVVGGKRNYSICVTTDIAMKIGILFSDDGDIELDEDVYASENCKRAFLRGAFIISGTITSPKKTYSCEVFSYNENMAFLASDILSDFGIYANTVKRKNYYVSYLRDKASVSDFLNIIGAHKNMMELMMTQIEKDVNNQKNRQLNCIAANVDKTIKTSAKQCEAILKLQKSSVWENIDEQSREIAILRLEHTEANLSEIGAMMKSPLSKGAVSRRMKKLTEMAEEL